MVSTHLRHSAFGCPSAEELRAFSHGQLLLERIESIGNHLTDCVGCAAALTTLDEGEDSFIRSLRVAGQNEALQVETGCLRLEAAACGIRLSDETLKDGDHRQSVPRRPASPLPQWWGTHLLLERIGSGGMGVVYRARSRILEREVALKVLRSGDLADSGEVERFRIEARALARLDHPHVVPIYELGEHEGQPYFTMKLLTGGSLESRLARLKGHPSEAVALLEKVARAVHYLHQNQVLHRDLKPLNILFDDKGEPYLTDFGLAKLLESGLELTNPGSVLGSLHYMSPEQASSRVSSFSSATDVWSLGVILYELLAGERPFPGANREAVTSLILEAHPKPPGALRPGLDTGLDRVVLQCLQKVPQHRYTSANALADDLALWLRGELPGLPRHSWMRQAVHLFRKPAPRRRGSWLAACLFLALAAGLALRSLLPSGATPEDSEKGERQESMTLVGVQGQPSHFRWIWGKKQSSLGTTPDGKFSLRTWDVAMLELLGQPPGPRYRFQAEIRHDENDRGHVGIYYAHHQTSSEQGIKHCCCRLTFRDPQPLKPGRMDLNLTAWREGAGMSQSQVGLGYLPFGPDPVLQPDRTWYPLTVEVSPEVVAVYCKEKCMSRTTRTDLLQSSARLLGPLNQGQWEPTSGGLGLYVQEGAASFQKVIVTPLPESVPEE